MEEVAELKTLENYELMLVFLSDLGEEGIKKELDELKKHISSDGGEILNEDTWGNHELAYRIKKQNQGFYYVLNFKIGPEHIAEMQRNLTISPAVVRFLLVKTPVNYVFRTFEEYQASAEKEAAKKQEEKEKLQELQKARKSKIEKKAPVKTESKKIKVEETIAEPEKETPKKPEKKAKKTAAPTKLEEVDAKLKSIIDDPDITL